MGGEADTVQVGEVGLQVMFPGQHERGRAQVGFVQDEHHVLLKLCGDVVVECWGKL